MLVDAEFTVKIKMTDLFVGSDLVPLDFRNKIIEEGEKRLRYYLSGYLKDPENKVIEKEINFKIKGN